MTQAKAKRDPLADAVRSLVALPEGRRVLQWLLKECNVSGPVLCGDMEAAGRREGRREIGRMISIKIIAAYGRVKLAEIEDETHG